jgi:hypothetical protein
MGPAGEATPEPAGPSHRTLIAVSALGLLASGGVALLANDPLVRIPNLVFCGIALFHLAMALTSRRRERENVRSRSPGQ